MADNTILLKKSRTVIWIGPGCQHCGQHLINNWLPLGLLGKSENFGSALPHGCAFMQRELLAHANSQIRSRNLAAFNALEEFLNVFFTTDEQIENLTAKA